MEDTMILEHIALYTNDLEGMRKFYEKYFGAKSNSMYHNLKTGLQTYFLTFEGGARLEIMYRPNVTNKGDMNSALGLTHMAFRVGNKEKVDELTEDLIKDGFLLKSGPRMTGDGYYESCIFDPEGNEIEIVA
jgi:lactoylglutathione lyase